MRRKDFRGAKEWSGNRELMCCRMVAREAGWKMVGSLSWVIRRVLDGGEGWLRGGIVERSIERGEAERRWVMGLGEEEVELGGEEVAGWECGCG